MKRLNYQSVIEIQLQFELEFKDGTSNLKGEVQNKVEVQK